MYVAQAISFFLVLVVAGTAAASSSKFPELKGNPNLRSASAIVLDASGELIYGKDVDTVRPIASITKLMTAMVVLDAGLDLDEEITISSEDPAGLNAKNVSTATDLARMLVAADRYPLITQFTTTTEMAVRPYTNRLRKWLLANS